MMRCWFFARSSLGRTSDAADNKILVQQYQGFAVVNGPQDGVDIKPKPRCKRRKASVTRLPLLLYLNTANIA
jgi:hypothetical protein